MIKNKLIKFILTIVIGFVLSNMSAYSNSIAIPTSAQKIEFTAEVNEEVWREAIPVITSYSIHYTKLYDYLPPGYEKMSEKLPVLYLQHGGGDNDASWSTAGRSNFILDNLFVITSYSIHYTKLYDTAATAQSPTPG